MCLNDQLSTIVPIVLVLILLNIVQFTITEECDLPECLEKAKRISESIDESIDPCDDFMEFACGKQFKKFDEMRTLNYHQDVLEPTTYRLHLWWIRKRLQRELNHPVRFDDTRTVKLARIFWQKCKEIKSTDALASARSLFKRLGGWPVITESWNEQNFTWDKFSKCSRRLGFFPRMFIHVGVDVDDVKRPWHPNDTIKLTIERPKPIKFQSPSDIHTLENIAFFTIAEYITEGKAPKITEIDQALEFGAQLHRLDCELKQSGPKHQEMSIIQLQKKYPIITWIDYIRSMVAPRQAMYLSKYSCMMVDVCYLSLLGKFLNETSKYIQANYAFLAIISDLFTVIRPELGLTFTSSQTDIEEMCFDTTTAIFRKALDIIIAKTPEQKLTNKTEQVENRIYNLTLQIILKVPWMDPETQTQSRMKLEVTSFRSPFPDGIFNEKYFNRLDLRQQDALPVMFRQVNNFLIDSYYLQAGRSRTKYGIYRKEDKIMGAIFENNISPNEAIVKPDRFSNTVFIPAAAILHSRLSTLKQLDFVNYATIGIQIAAALSHHIYQKGTHIDFRGQWQRDSWWSKTTQEQFMSRQSCQAIGPMKPIAEASTIFGFIGATEIAYLAMFGQCLTTPCSETLQGLKYTTQQLFWISAVASDCDRTLKYRYNVMVSHNENFTNDFKCSEESQMYIRDKCKMWIQ